MKAHVPAAALILLIVICSQGIISCELILKFRPPNFNASTPADNGNAPYNRFVNKLFTLFSKFMTKLNGAVSGAAAGGAGATGRPQVPFGGGVGTAGGSGGQQVAAGGIWSAPLVASRPPTEVPISGGGGSAAGPSAGVGGGNSSGYVIQPNPVVPQTPHGSNNSITDETEDPDAVVSVENSYADNDYDEPA